MGLMTSAAFTLGGRRMGRAFLPETIDLMTAQAEIRFFLQQIGWLFGTMGIVAGLAVETGNRLMGQGLLGTAAAVFGMAVQANFFTGTGQQEGFGRSMGQVAELTAAVDKRLVAVGFPALLADLLMAAVTKIARSSDQQGVMLPTMGLMTSTAVTDRKRSMETHGGHLLIDFLMTFGTETTLIIDQN